tara:strand:+ start:46 stop:345 length:300 start_codon:yes stop_codon:yes gene_type:complete
MFDNFGTALVQAIGFFGVFGFFVYQLLTDGKKSIKTQLKPSIKKDNEAKDLKNKIKKKGLFGKKTEPIEQKLKPKKKGIFGRKEDSIEVLEKPKKKGWF